MSNGETITITITGNPKSGKSTIAVLISEYLTQQGLRVLDDSDMNGAKARACLDAEMDKRGAVSL